MIRPKRRTVITITAVVAVFVIAALVVTLTGGNGQASDRQYLGGGTSAWLYKAGHRPAAPAFSGTTLTGSKLASSQYEDKTLVLNFWGSWCGPCRGEAPTLAALSQKYAKRGVAFLGDDVGDTPVNAQSFARSMGIAYPSLNDPGYQTAQDFGTAVPINATPTTLVLDSAGHVAGVIYGTATYAVLDKMLHDVVKA